MFLERRNSLKIKRKKKVIPHWGFRSELDSRLRRSISSVPAVYECNRKENLSSPLDYPQRQLGKCHGCRSFFLHVTDQILLLCNSDRESPIELHAERRMDPSVSRNLPSLSFVSITDTQMKLQT